MVSNLPAMANSTAATFHLAFLWSYAFLSEGVSPNTSSSCEFQNWIKIIRTLADSHKSVSTNVCLFVFMHQSLDQSTLNFRSDHDSVDWMHATDRSSLVTVHAMLLCTRSSVIICAISLSIAWDVWVSKFNIKTCRCKNWVFFSLFSYCSNEDF